VHHRARPRDKKAQIIVIRNKKENPSGALVASVELFVTSETETLLVAYGNFVWRKAFQGGRVGTGLWRKQGGKVRRVRVEGGSGGVKRRRRRVRWRCAVTQMRPLVKKLLFVQACQPCSLNHGHWLLRLDLTTNIGRESRNKVA